MPGSRLQLTIILIAAFTWSVVSAIPSEDVLSTRGWSALGEIVSAFFQPDLSPDFLSKVIADSWRTVAFAIAGMTIAVILGIPLGVLASGTLQRSRLSKLGVMTGARAILAALRAVHEIVWAILFVTAFGLSPMAGALAIGIPYAGILGRVLAERLQDTPEAPLDAMRASGASELSVLLYGRIPMASADVVSYTFYRLECAVRAAAVLSFVGLGGLGFRITIALDDLAFGQAWTAIFALLLIIIGIDTWSGLTRKRLNS